MLALYETAFSRLYVHLLKDIDTAKNVGKRHGKPIVHKILAEKIYMSGYEFFLSQNGIWLTKHVLVEFLEKISQS